MTFDEDISSGTEGAASRLESAIVTHGACTLAGIKTGSLFSVCGDKREIREALRRLNGMLTRKGMRIVPLISVKGKTMIYLYLPESLKEDLQRAEAREILILQGYHGGCPENVLAQLCRRLHSGGAFPHEIGLFLGYPPSDVRGFMESPCEGVKCAGSWKAYSNETEAQRTFERYRRCTASYRAAGRRGISLETLLACASPD